MIARQPRLRCDKCTDWITDPARCRLAPTAPQPARGCNKATPTLNLCAACYATAEALCIQWQPLPHFVLRKHSAIRPQHSMYEEALSDLHRVFWVCCVKYNPRRGYQFNTYAVSSMRQALKTFYRNRSRQGFAGNSDGTADVGVTSLNSERGDGDSSIIATLADDAMPTDELLHRAEQQDFIERVLSRIDTRHAFVLRARLLATPAWTLDEVGAELNVTRERVRQLELKAKERFRLVVAEMDNHERLLEAVL